MLNAPRSDRRARLWSLLAVRASPRNRAHARAHKLRIAKSTILIAPNNEGKSNILQALVTALRIVSELGRVEIMPGRLRSTRFIRESYDWDRDFPDFALSQPGFRRSN